MRGLLIIGIIAAAFVLFCLLPLGVTIIFGKPVAAKVIIGPIRLQIAPAKPSGKKKKAGKEKEKPEKEDRIFKTGRAFLKKLKESPKSTLETLKSLYRSLWPPTKKTLRRLLRGIRIDPMQIGVTLGGRKDPAGTAALYGVAEGAVWSVMPALERWVRIPHPGIHLGIDFDSEKTDVTGEIGISIRIGTLLAIGIEIGVPALRWFLKYKKQQEHEKKQVENSLAERPAA